MSSAALTSARRPAGAVAATSALLALAAPMIGMAVSRMMVNFIDTWMVSMLGTAALAAIAPATLLLFAISCLGMGTAQGVQTFVAQADGRGEPHRAGPYVWQSIYIALISAILTSPIVLFLPTWFDAFGRFFGHPPDVLRMQIQFLTIALWSVAPATACAGIESFYNGIKKPIIGFIAVLASLVTVIVGNYALIFGHWGFPALGIAGSAYATILSWCVRLAVVMTPLFFWKQIDERYHIRRSVAFDPAKLGELVRVGGPISAQWLVDIGAWVVFQQVLMPSFGPVALAAMTIAIQCMHLAFMPALGVGMALTTQVGNAIGAGEPDRAAEHVRVARRVIIAYMGSVAALFLIIPGPMSRIFTQDPTVISATAAALIWCACFQISDALCITYSFALRGAGDTRAPAVLFAVCCWGIFVVGGWLVKWAAPQIGEHGPWIMCMSYIIVLSGLLWWRFASGAWRKIRLFGEKPADAPAFPAAVEEAEAAPVATGSP